VARTAIRPPPAPRRKRSDGAGGRDTLNSNDRNDTILARDGAADSVSCGPGTDRAVVDPLDTVSPDCETVE
jgi:hypothetical protein